MTERDNVSRRAQKTSGGDIVDIVDIVDIHTPTPQSGNGVGWVDAVATYRRKTLYGDGTVGDFFGLLGA